MTFEPDTTAADLDLLRAELAAGESVALLGAARSGKTACLRSLIGLTGHTPVRPETLHRDRTIAQNVALGMGPGPHPADGAIRVQRWLRAFGLTPIAARPVGQVGADAVCRTALARAMAGDPRVLLLDEPFRGCEPDQRGRLAGALRHLQRRHRLGIVLATAEAAEARATVERVRVMRSGKVVQQGGMVEVYERPVSAYAARCLGEVNLLPGRVEALGEGLAWVVLADGTEVEAMAADAPAGAACLIALRPERIAVAAMAPAALGPGAVAALVLERVHHGDHVRLLLRVGQSRVAVRRPPGPEPAPGQAVSIAWQTSHAHACLPDADFTSL